MVPKISLKDYIQLNPTKRLAAGTFLVVSFLVWYGFISQESQKKDLKDDAKQANEKVVIIQRSCDSVNVAMVQNFRVEMERELRKQLSDIKEGLADRERKLDNLNMAATKAIKTNREVTLRLKKTNSQVLNNSK